MLRKFYHAFRNFIKYIRKGGVVYVNIAQVNYGECLKGKRIVVTGGGSGIGYAIAGKFLASGAEVTITGRNAEKLAGAAGRLNSEKVHTLVWDVADVSVAGKKIGEAAQMMGGLDILVNNAGVYIPSNLFSIIEEKDWDSVMGTNIKGVFFASRATAAYFIRENKSRGGKIINISSIAGINGDCGPYGISKWGVNGLTKGLARDLIGKNIIVNAIAPGVIATEMNKDLNVADNAYSPAQKNERVTLVEEIADLALFLASDASNNIVGQVIVCDGGWTLG